MPDRDSPYAPDMDDPILTFDAREEEEDTRRGPIILIAAIIFVVVFGAVLWNFYRQGVREGGRDAAPQIVADASPYRAAPADPGGAQTPDQDTAVYDAAQGQTGPRLKVEQVDALEAPAPAAVAVAAAPAAAPPTDLRPKDRQPLPDLRPRDASKVAPPQAAPAATPPAARPAAAPPRAVPPVQQAQPAPRPAPAPAAGGAVSVQLGAFGSQALADAAWGRLGGAAAGRSPQISTVERDGRTLYRLRTGGFASRDEARAFCAQVTAAGGACIVASN